MNENRWIRVLCSILCITMLGTVFTSCNRQETVKEKQMVVAEPMGLMEIEEVNTFSFDAIGGKDVMPIGGYHGPQAYSYSANGQKLPNYFSEEFMQMVAECGVNLITANGAEYTEYPSKTLELLEVAEKYGVGVFVNDTTVTRNIGENVLSVEEMDRRVSDYINYPACVGVYVIDEPKTDYYRSNMLNYTIEELSPIIKNLVDLDITPYTNLFPMVSSGVANVYKDYIQEMVDCGVPYLSYDRYPFYGGNNLDDANDYFINMALVREMAEDAGITFWCFVEAGSQHNDAMEKFDSTDYWPSKGAFMWSANTALAFGAKGLQYFPLLQPYWYAYAKTEDYDFGRNGLIGAWNNKNRWWYYAKIVNHQIAAVDEVLMNSVNKGVIASGESAKVGLDGVNYVMEGTSWRELTGVKGDTMIGCFNYYGKSAFYVVNYDIEYSQKITLDFSDCYKMKVIQEGEENYLATDCLEITMRAGEGVLVLME